LSLTTIERDLNVVVTKEGVRHLDDPDAKPTDRELGGGWDHKPRTKALVALLGDLAGDAKKK
jgi:hypothetical protein